MAGEKGYSDCFIKVLRWTLLLVLILEMQRDILPPCPQFISSLYQSIAFAPHRKKLIQTATKQSDFTVVSEGKVGKNVQFLVVERSGPWTRCWKEARDPQSRGPGLAANTCV